MRRIATVLLASLAGCASLSEDGGFSDVQQAVEQRAGAQTVWQRSGGESASVRARVEELLAKPLGSQEAVQIALLNNPGLQAAYAEVGIAEADLVQASRWRGPTFSFARLRRGDETEYERSVFFDVLGLLTIPLSVRGEEARFAAAKSRAAGEGLRIALEARKAWFNAVAARETARYMAQVKEAAEASAELARRMAAAGNFPKLTLLREQAFYAETTAQLAAAQHAESATREALARLMGLWGGDLRFELPERLPELPKAPRESGADLEAQALTERLDVQAARRDNEAVARSLGLTRATRFVSLLDFGLLSNSETGAPRQRGWEIEVGVPIFDFGSARTARAERTYMQSMSRVKETAIRARSEVRVAYTAYRTNFDLARHYRDEVVPLRKRISEEVLLRYNGMLASVFELLADSREQVLAVNAYIETLRAFWVAESDFQMALTSGAPGAAGGIAGTRAPAAAGGGGH
jgi:outer membrane protein TolC